MDCYTHDTEHIQSIRGHNTIRGQTGAREAITTMVLPDRSAAFKQKVVRAHESYTQMTGGVQTRQAGS